MHKKAGKNTPKPALIAAAQRKKDKKAAAKKKVCRAIVVLPVLTFLVTVRPGQLSVCCGTFLERGWCVRIG
jgi:hypothetical protein